MLNESSTTRCRASDFLSWAATALTGEQVLSGSLPPPVSVKVAKPYGIKVGVERESYLWGARSRLLTLQQERRSVTQGMEQSETSAEAIAALVNRCGTAPNPEIIADCIRSGVRLHSI
jgi:hypothetical protein